MNEEEMKQLREQMEVRIVALLLGEASAFETAEIEQAMQRDPDLAAFHAEMRGTIELTREASKQFQTATAPVAAQPKLSADRREKLLAHFRQGKVVEVPIKRATPFRRRWLVPASLAAGIVVLVSILSVVNYRRGRQSLALVTTSVDREEAQQIAKAIPAQLHDEALGRTVNGRFSRTINLESAPQAAPPTRPLAAGDNVQNSGLVTATKPQPSEAAPKLYLPGAAPDGRGQISKGDLLDLAQTTRGRVLTLDGAAQQTSTLELQTLMDTADGPHFLIPDGAVQDANRPAKPYLQAPSKPSAENETVETLAGAVNPSTSMELARAKSEGKVLEWAKSDNASELAHAEGLKPIEHLREMSPSTSKDPEWIGVLDKESKVARGIDNAPKAGESVVTAGALESKRGEKPPSAGIVLPQEPVKGMLASSDSPTAGNGPATTLGAKSGAYASANSPVVGTPFKAELYSLDTDASKPKSRADSDGDGAHGTAEYSDSSGFGGIGGGGGLGGGRPARTTVTNATWAFAGQPAKDANGSGTMDYSGFRFGGGFAGGGGTSGGLSGKAVVTNSIVSTFTTGNNWAFAGQPAPGTTTAPAVRDVPLNGSLFGNEGFISLEGKNRNLSGAVDQNAMKRSDISGPTDVDFSFGRSSTLSFQQRIGTRVAPGQAATPGSHEESDGFLMLGKAAESVPAALPTPALAPPIDKIADPNGTLSGPALLAANPISADPKKDVKAGDIDNYDLMGDIGGPMIPADTARKHTVSSGATETARTGAASSRFFRLKAPETPALDWDRSGDRSAKDEPARPRTLTQQPASTALGIIADDERSLGKASEDSISVRTARLTPPSGGPTDTAQSVNGRAVQAGGVYSVNAVGYTNSAHQVRGNVITLDSASQQTLDQAEMNLNRAIQLDPHNEAAYHELDLIREQRHHAENLAREAKNNEWMLGVDKGWRGDTPKGDPLPQTNARTNLARSSVPLEVKLTGYVNLQNSPTVTNFTEATKSRGSIRSKLSQIRLGEFKADGLPLSQVVKNLNDEARLRDPEKRGINFLLGLKGDSATLEPTTGLPNPSAAEQAELRELTNTTITINPPLNDITLEHALSAVQKVAGDRFKFSVEDYGVVLSRNPEAKDKEDVPAIKTPPASTPQPEINTRQNAFSTFSLNVSDVSFKLAAASLDNSVMPDPASIRVEEFVNAFNYHDPAPAAGARMAFAWERAHYPFAHNRDIVRFAIQTAAHGREAQKPLNLVILLDNSGSMERADRVQIVREALKVLAQKLQPQDRISVVTFARTARLWVDGMAGGKPKEFLDKVLELNPDGGTNLEDALALGYATAAKHFLANGMNRVILLTDGAANLGNVEPEALKQKVISNRIKGIALDCFGIGWEGYNDDLLEVLSHNGDGRYGFLDHPEEAAPEFANQLAGALSVEAADVKTQVEFNPRRVLTWRQIGYAKHQLTKEQFRDNKVDAAELAASESGNALYAIEVNPEGSGPLGTVRVRYKIPATGQYVEQSWPLPYQPRVPALDESSPAMRLAVTAAAFGEWLARSPYAGEVTPAALQPYLNSVCETYAPDSRPQRLAGMIRQAEAIAGK